MNPIPSPYTGDKYLESMGSDVLTAARLVYAHLALSLPPKDDQIADAVIGFGHFDLRIAERCMLIEQQGLAKRIIFSGGVGAGSADLHGPEAEKFRDVVFSLHPNRPNEDIILETRSTNTGENVRFTAELLQQTKPELVFGKGIRSVILVATPIRMRRVWLTFRAICDKVQTSCMPPESDLVTDCALFHSKGQDLIAQLPGELERLATYPSRGWILAEPIPDDVSEACRLITSIRKL